LYPKNSGPVKSPAYLLGDLLNRVWHPSNPPRVSMRNGWLAGWLIQVTSGRHRTSLLGKFSQEQDELRRGWRASNRLIEGGIPRHGLTPRQEITTSQERSTRRPHRSVYPLGFPEGLSTEDLRARYFLGSC
jgi:hypothetical protein